MSSPNIDRHKPSGKYSSWYSPTNGASSSSPADSSPVDTATPINCDLPTPQPVEKVVAQVQPLNSPTASAPVSRPILPLSNASKALLDIRRIPQANLLRHMASEFLPSPIDWNSDRSPDKIVPVSKCGLLSGTWSEYYARVDAFKKANPSVQVKTLYMVRHAEGTHNVAEKQYGSELWDKVYSKDPIYTDAELTDFGKSEGEALKEALPHALAEGLHIDAIVCSPLRRTLQTGTLSLEPLQHTTPYLSVENGRECYGVHTCDKRFDVSAKKADFPDVDFHIADDVDPLWTADKRETDEEELIRTQRYLDFLFSLEAENIVTVGHAGSLGTIATMAWNAHRADETLLPVTRLVDSNGQSMDVGSALSEDGLSFNDVCNFLKSDGVLDTLGVEMRHCVFQPICLVRLPKPKVLTVVNPPTTALNDAQKANADVHRTPDAYLIRHFLSDFLPSPWFWNSKLFPEKIPPVEKCGLLSGTWGEYYAHVAAFKAANPNVQMKTLYMVRHAQGIHNVAEEQFGEEQWDKVEAKNPKYTDAVLTDFGISETVALKNALPQALQDGLKIDLIVSSPLRRTLQTATYSLPALLTTTSLLSVENARERFGVNTCDQRLRMAWQRPGFPHVDFQVADNLDLLWNAEQRETAEAELVRTQRYLDFLFSLEAENIVTVGHAGSLGSIACKAWRPYDPAEPQLPVTRLVDAAGNPPVGSPLSADGLSYPDVRDFLIKDGALDTPGVEMRHCVFQPVTLVRLPKPQVLTVVKPPTLALTDAQKANLDIRRTPQANLVRHLLNDFLPSPAYWNSKLFPEKIPPVSKCGLLTGTWGEYYAHVAAFKAAHPNLQVKTLYLVRHAQGTHNVAEEHFGSEQWDNVESKKPEYTDPVLTDFGISETVALKEALPQALQEGLKIDAIVSSPLRRTLQTGTYSLPALFPTTPFLSVENARERFGDHTCDQRFAMQVQKPAFPHVDFHVADDRDPLWTTTRETEEQELVRTQRYLDFLFSLEAENIVAVGHAGSLGTIANMAWKFFTPEEVVPPIVKGASGSDSPLNADGLSYNDVCAYLRKDGALDTPGAEMRHCVFQPICLVRLPKPEVQEPAKL